MFTFRCDIPVCVLALPWLLAIRVRLCLRGGFRCCMAGFRARWQ